MRGGNQDIEGYEIPLYVSLTQRVFLGGVPRTPFIIMATLCLVIGLSWQQPVIAGVVWVVWYGTSRLLLKNDPYFYEVFLRALRHVKSTWRTGGFEG